MTLVLGRSTFQSLRDSGVLHDFEAARVPPFGRRIRFRSLIEDCPSSTRSTGWR
jgi:hypothetical protein